VAVTERRVEVRLAESIAALSLATDLGLGLPMEHVLRQCVVALTLGERLGLEESERSAVYYVALLAWVGCHADSYEQARWFGDDISARAATYGTDMSPSGRVRFAGRQVGAGLPPLRRARTAIEFAATGREALESMHSTHCLLAGELAERLDLGEPVRDALLQMFERWDGKGQPDGLVGTEIARPARLVQLADVVEVYHRTGGVDAAVAVARERRGTQFDPALVDVFCSDPEGVLAPQDAATSWDAVIEAQPGLRRKLGDAELDAALEAFADFADLKSPYTLGHSRGVADLAAAAGPAYGIPDGELRTLRRAALVHDLGRLGISNTIWDKPGALTPAECERVRLHPYLTERVLSASGALAALGALAAQHHERLDGSGYPRGLTGQMLSPCARLLAAADVYHALREPRPHRPACSPEEAARELRAEVRAGRLDGAAADAVLAAAGHRVGRRRRHASDLTPREVEVLCLVARGLPNKEIARRLSIAPKTVGNHVDHVYRKIGVSSRAAAALFATEHGLLAEHGGGGHLGVGGR
jgi:HD-GYP domain-containing protein (c-di-GMP phosphodiesterase class II)